MMDKKSRQQNTIGLISSSPSKILSFVHPMRIELISSEPESGILSIELRVHSEKWCKNINNLFVFLTNQEKIHNKSQNVFYFAYQGNKMQTKKLFLLALL